MIRFVREGDTLKNGLNIYHPSEWKHSSRGFKFRWNSRFFMFRYSVDHKVWIIKTFSY